MTKFMFSNYDVMQKSPFKFLDSFTKEDNCSGQWAVWQLAVGRRWEAVGNGIEDLWNLDVT